MEIKIIKEINVFGFEMSVGTFITKNNNNTLQLARYQYPEIKWGHSMFYPLICENYSKTADEFITEINRLNT